ncbi:MAG: ribonucleoside-diphosphate reductase subunit alpha [Verrucomicrobia bacterium]|nr:ribonucleoside-diphosphate reductase subunit alpha [Verrucomicrobiota bacterium]
MFYRESLEEDQALKRFVLTPKDQKPRFDWGLVVGSDAFKLPNLKIDMAGEPRDFSLAEIADTIGGALTNLMLSRRQDRAEEIFSEHNRAFVAGVARAVGQVLGEHGDQRRLTQQDVHLAIERALIEHNAHDVARSLVMKRVQDPSTTDGTLHVRLIRRNGQVVPWNENKIEIAVRKAFLSRHHDSDAARAIARAVTGRVRDMDQAFVHIEDVQDFVQEELMKAGHYRVAEAYILYRAERTEMRATESTQQQAPASHQDTLINVQRPDGSSYLWDGTRLRAEIAFAMIGLDLSSDRSQIEIELRRSLAPSMTEDDLKKTILLNAKALIEKDGDFAKFAARIQLTHTYEEVLGWDIARDGVARLKDAHRQAFRNYVEHGIKIRRLAPRLLEYDLDKLADALDPSADLDFDYLGIQTLYDRYLIVDKTGARPRRIETPQFFWMRVAMGLFLNETEEREDWVIKLYGLYKHRRFCSSTPTLFNSGTLHSQLSSCYLYKVDDSIESIMIRGIAENAFLSKWAGGLGGSWTAVRGTGSYISGTNGESQGVIPFLKLHNDQLVAVNQGGKRRGSGCAYLECWHNDILDFLELRRNTGDDRRRTHDMNTANWIPDLFMKRMESREQWTLFRANETPDLHELYGEAFEQRYVHYERMADEGKIQGQRIPALELWKQMLKMLFETGHPWITFKDPCNLRSPQDHTGVIHSSNLCTEITLNTSTDETAVCNLGSIVLDTHLDADGNLKHAKLRDTIRVAVRALDNVIDLNFYPTEAARRSNMRHRPVGLGVMGLHNALYRRKMSFASDEAVAFNDEFMEAIAYYAYEASSDLAKERGTYETYTGSKWSRGIMPADTLELLERERGVAVEVPRGGRMDWQPLRARIARQGMRNSNVLAIAPTATISNIMGTTPCIEPSYKNLFVKSNLSGDFIVLNVPLARDLKERGLWNQELIDNLKYFDGDLEHIPGVPEDLKRKYVTAFQIDFNYIIQAAARRQKWIDQSQSVNLFLGQPDMKMLSHMYRAAWRQGLKTTYYLRTLAASNIEKATVSARKETRGVVAHGLLDSGNEAPRFTDEEKQACSLESMRNGGECEACQ